MCLNIALLPLCALEAKWRCGAPRASHALPQIASAGAAPK
jgi:uncharacterized protein (DUF1684 family)